MRELKPIQPLPPIRRDMDILANRLPSTRALANRTLALEYEGGGTSTLAFAAAKVRWTAVAPGKGTAGGEDAYDAVEVRPGVFFVDYVVASGRKAWSHAEVGIEFGRSPLGPVDRRCGAKITFLGEFVYPEGYGPG